MISDRKCRLMLFADYLLTIVLSMFGLRIFSWMIESAWGNAAYSVLFTLLFLGLVYSRCWNKAKSDLKYQKEKARLTNAIKVLAPLVIFFAVVITVFALIKYNIIPIRDIVTDIQYILEENKPRQTHYVLLYDRLLPAMRILFAFLLGFFPASDISVLVLLIAPVATILGGVLGYFAGMRTFYLSEVIAKAQKKAKDKFYE